VETCRDDDQPHEDRSAGEGCSSDDARRAAEIAPANCLAPPAGSSAVKLGVLGGASETQLIKFRSHDALPQ
jgi:hypothetical protein